MRQHLPFVCLLALASCATPTPAERLARSECGDLRVQGDPASFTLSGAPLGDASVAAPEWCEAGLSSYILVTRADGARRIVDDGSGYPDSCPADPDPSSACDVVPRTPFLRAVLARTSAAGIVGSGGIPDDCTDLKDPVSQWRWSIGVHDWAEADATARVIADELRRWDVAGSLAVSVEPRDCITIE